MAQVTVGLPEVSEQDKANVFAFYGSEEKAVAVHRWLDENLKNLQELGCAVLDIAPIQFLAGLQATVSFRLGVEKGEIYTVETPDPVVIDPDAVE